VRGELPMEEDIVEKQKQWISVALRTESDSALNSKHNGKSSALLAVLITLGTTNGVIISLPIYDYVICIIQ